MRGYSFFSLALVAIASTAYAAPLNSDSDVVEARGLMGKFGVVDAGKDFTSKKRDLEVKGIQ